VTPWLHSLVAVQSRRPAWALGLRVATIVIVPLVVGLIVDELGYGLIATLGALNVAIADPGGADRLRARALLGATVAEALLLAVGTLVGAHAALAIPLIFVIACAAGLAGAFGEVVGNVAFFSTVMFIIGVGLAGDASDALDRLWLVALGGAWAMLLSLALWPVRPLRPAQLAIASAFGSIASYLRRFIGTVGDLRPAPGRTVLGASEPRAKLAAARDTLNLVEGLAPGGRPAARAFDALSAEGDALLARCEALAAQVAGLPAGTEEGLRGRVSDAIGALARAVAALDALLAHPRRRMPRRDDLDRSLDAFDAAIGGLRARVAAGHAAIEDVVTFRGVDLTLRECAALTERATALARRAVSERRRRDVAGRAERGRAVSAGPRTWIAVVRAQLSPDSALLRHALRFGVALAAGLAIAALFDIQRGYWIDITVAVILRPYIVTTFERGLQRVVGTILGGFIAAGLLSTVSGDIAVVAVLAVLAFLTFAVLPLNYGWAVTFLTPLVVLLVAFALGAGPSVAIDRIVDTLIGAAIAVGAALLLWPQSERGGFGAAVAVTVKSQRAYLDAVLAGDDASPARGRAAAAADDLQGRSRRLAGEPRRGRHGLGAVWEAVAGCRRLYVATVALEAQLRRGGPAVSLHEIRDALDDASDAIAAAFRAGDAPSGAADAVDRALTGLRDDVARLADRRMEELAASPEFTATGSALRSRALVLAELDACATALHRLESAASATA
jgi:uncharacterized membrane protein YccC